MGFLTDGRAMEWDEVSGKVSKYVQTHGVAQFIAVYNRCKDLRKDEFLWGDEVEFIVVKVNAAAKTTVLSLRADAILARLNEHAQKLDKEQGGSDAKWLPEYGNFMVEATPGKPYHGIAFDEVEANMRNRRKVASMFLEEDERILTITAFPRMGAQDGLWHDRLPSVFTHPPHHPGGGVALSAYTPDALINPHPRFAALTKNIRTRRGAKVCICVPLMIDEFTHPVPNDEHSHLRTHRGSVGSQGSPSMYYLSEAMKADFHGDCESMAKAVVIHMDSMAFGMGMCCLQTTFQCETLSQARSLTDQLAVLSPYILCLSVATPILKGLLARTDARWDVISGSVDDRTPEERGLRGDPKKRIWKSRYDSISCFISDSPRLDDAYHNDLDLDINEDALQQMREAGIDERLSRHVAHLFVREPLVVYDNKVELDNDQHTDHWENIQSTNWQSVRFKPPPPNSDIGWRVEFRVTELQLSDFENAAFAVVTCLLARTILFFDLNLYIPITKVDANIARSQTMNAVELSKFHFRAQILPPSDPNFLVFYHRAEEDAGNAHIELSLNEIMNGGGNFKGLLAGVRAFIEKSGQVDVNSPSLPRLHRYLELISRRAACKLRTTASWVRDFVTSHPQYKKDSIVSNEIAHDLLAACVRIGEGTQHEPELTGGLELEQEQEQEQEEGGVAFGLEL